MEETEKHYNRAQFLAENMSQRATLHRHLDFAATEQYKLIRANLDFTLPQDEKCPVIGITSSVRGEGKSTTAVNLSYVCAEKGSKVLLIDGDMRLPSIAKKMGIDGSPGLSEMLIGNEIPMMHFQSFFMDNWYILPSGFIPPNPSELLGSPRMKDLLERLKEEFDYIIIDLPPVNIVSDSVSISSLTSGMIVVVRERYTDKRDLAQCFRQLQLAKVHILGCVMNDASPDKSIYGKYRRYKYYKYAASNAKGVKK